MDFILYTFHINIGLHCRCIFWYTFSTVNGLCTRCNVFFSYIFYNNYCMDDYVIRHEVACGVKKYYLLQYLRVHIQWQTKSAVSVVDRHNLVKECLFCSSQELSTNRYFLGFNFLYKSILTATVASFPLYTGV